MKSMASIFTSGRSNGTTCTPRLRMICTDASPFCRADASLNADRR